RPPRQDQPHRVLQRIMLRSDGEPVYCELHVTLSVQDDGTQFWLVAFQDITERRRTAEALRYQATHDDLTGLPNRSAVKDLLRRLWQWADTHSIAVLYCDIDNFKRINDSLGHDAGDELLVALANRLEEGLPPGCIPARISGDVFVIICQDLEPAGGIDELISQVAALLRTPVPVGGQLLRVTAATRPAPPTSSSAPSPPSRAPRCRSAGNCCGSPPPSGRRCPTARPATAKTCSGSPTPPCTRPNNAAPARSPSPAPTSSPTPTTRCSWKGNCAKPCTGTNSCCTTSRWWTATAGPSARKPCCAGNTPNAASSAPTCSSRWPNKATCCRTWTAGCCAPRSPKPAPGPRRSEEHTSELQS